MPEGGMAPLGEKRKLVEFNDISRNPVTMFHATEPDAIFCVPNQIVRLLYPESRSDDRMPAGRSEAGYRKEVLD
jgi:hypothetical protein